MTAPISNLMIAFEALATGRTLDDAYLLLLDLGYKDKIILVGSKGITTLERVCNNPDWAMQPVEKTIVRFRGGPPTGLKHIFTASVRCLVIDRLIKAVEEYGLEKILDSIRTIWGINVKTCNDSSAAPVCGVERV